jgi:NADH:ubiquinone oxidoreductase subunit E
MNVQICVGSSCHLTGSEQIVTLFQKAVEERNLGDKITLAGSFCIGRCNREGVTIQVDDDVFTGVTPANFEQFFQTNILGKL